MSKEYLCKKAYLKIVEISWNTQDFEIGDVFVLAQSQSNMLGMLLDVQQDGVIVRRTDGRGWANTMGEFCWRLNPSEFVFCDENGNVLDE